MSKLDSKIPEGPLKDKWTNHKNKINLVNPANKRLIDVIVVGTGLAGGSASASLAEMGYKYQFITVLYLWLPKYLRKLFLQGLFEAEAT